MSYMPCELHCHTVHSDGDFSVSDLLKAATDDNLSLIALTDHNTISGYEELEGAEIPAIKGIEWTTFFGHMLVLGATKYVDWRDATPQNINKKIKQIKSNNGVVGIAHPYQYGSPVCTGGRWQFELKNFAPIDYVEIWHESFGEGNYENEQAFEFWTSLLDKGYHIAAVYGRDWHRLSNDGHYGCTYIDIDGEINQPKALAAIKKGSCVASTGAKFFFRAHQRGNTYSIGDTLKKGEAVLSFFTDVHIRENTNGDNQVRYHEIRVVTNGGECVATTELTQRHIHIILKRNHWYRAELWGTVNGKKQMLAVTSPIYTSKF